MADMRIVPVMTEYKIGHGTGESSETVLTLLDQCSNDVHRKVSLVCGDNELVWLRAELTKLCKERARRIRSVADELDKEPQP
jgi:hypothetical protein